MYIRHPMNEERTDLNERSINSEILRAVRKNDTYMDKASICEANGFLFRSVLEDPDNIMESCRPEGKDVIAVASFGYPFHFLANGAKTVIGVDNSGQTILWNRLLRDAIAVSTQRELIHMFESFNVPDALKYEDCSYKNYYNDLMSKLKLTIRCEQPSESSYSSLVSGIDFMPIFIEKPIVISDLLKNDYSFIFDSGIFDRISDNVLNGALRLCYSDLLDCLRNLPHESLDIIYASSVRSFIKNGMSKYQHYEDQDSFEKEYDRELAKEVNRVLRKNGVFYEALIDSDDFRNYPITDFNYWKLNKQTGKKRPPYYRPEAIYLDKHHEWIVGIKE